MLTAINIRPGNGTATFDEVSVNNSDNVFFTNLDDKAHWPTISDDPIEPSQNSSQCNVPDSNGRVPPQENPPYTATYNCRIHEAEQGTIKVFAVLAADIVNLKNATKGQPIATQRVVKGGKSPYAISGEIFQVTDNSNVSSGPGVGPGLQLNATTDNTGITVSGTPTQSGTYTFTFEVNDGMGSNLQQVQYSMKVV